MSGALPVLDLREVVDVDAAASVIGPLQDEIADLEAELARLEDECARIDAEIAAGVEPGSPTAERAAAAVERLVDGWLAAEREVMRREVADAERTAAERVCRAVDEAAELVRAARAEAAAQLVQRAGTAGGAPVVPVASTPAYRARPSREGPEPTPDQANQTEPVPPVADAEQASQEVTRGAQDEAGFGAFWREADQAAAARSLVKAPLRAVLPMFAALWVIVALFLFFI